MFEGGKLISIIFAAFVLKVVLSQYLRITQSFGDSTCHDVVYYLYGKCDSCLYFHSEHLTVSSLYRCNNEKLIIEGYDTHNCTDTPRADIEIDWEKCEPEDDERRYWMADPYRQLKFEHIESVLAYTYSGDDATCSDFKLVSQFPIDRCLCFHDCLIAERNGTDLSIHYFPPGKSACDGPEIFVFSAREGECKQNDGFYTRLVHYKNEQN